MIVKICAPKLLVSRYDDELKKFANKNPDCERLCQSPLIGSYSYGRLDRICHFYCWLSLNDYAFYYFLVRPTELAACDSVDFYYFWCDFFDFINKNKIITEIMNEIGFGCVVVR